MKVLLFVVLFSIYSWNVAADTIPKISFDNEVDEMILSNWKFTFAGEYAKFPDILDLFGEAHENVKIGLTEEAFALYEEVRSVCLENGFMHGLSDAEFFQGELNYNWGNYDLALRQFLKARKIANQLGYATTEANALNYIGKFYHTRGAFDRSLNYFREGLDIALNTYDSAIISELYRNIGNYYNTIGNHSYALEALYNSLDFLDRENDPLNYASSCNHIGNVYQDQGNMEKSLEFHRMALNLRMIADHQDEIGKSLKNLGEFFEDLGEKDSAVIFYGQAMTIFEESGYKKGSIKVHNNLGRIRVSEGNMQEGISLLEQARDESKKIGYSKGVMNAHFELGKAYTLLSDEQTALFHFNLALDLAENHGMLELQRGIYFNLYHFYLSKEDFQTSLQHYITYGQLDDSIRDLQHLANIDELIIKHETRARERENEFLRKQNELQNTSLRRKNLILVFTIVALLSLIISIFTVFQNLKHKKKDNLALVSLNHKLKKLNMELNETNAEKDKMYSIFVHELRNPLLWFRNITRMLNRKYDDLSEDKIKKALESLDESATHSYHLMDNLLHWTRSQLGKIELNKEIFDLKEVINENVSFANTALKYRNISINCECKSTWIAADKMMISTTLRNLISNAIKFTPENGSINLRSILENGRVRVSVKDNGIGIQHDEKDRLFDPLKRFSKSGLLNEKGSGIGLLLCKEFIERNSGSLYFESEENEGTIFTFELPVLQTNDENPAELFNHLTGTKG